MREATAETGKGRLFVVACIAFFAAGMIGAAIGPAIPDLARQTNASTVAAGGMLSALFAGALAGQTAAGMLLRRVGHRRVLLAGMSICAIGTAGIAMSASLFLLLAATCFLGLGFGGVTVAGNIIAAEAAHGAGPLNFVNAMYGIGAIVQPALIGLAIVALGSGVPALWALPCAMLAGVVLLLLWVPDAPRAPEAASHVSPQARHASSKVLRSPLLWMICGFVFAYVSVEATISGWLPTLLEDAAGLPLAMGAVAASWFYLVITVVRFAAAWASRWVGPATILRVCVGLCFGGGVLLAARALLESRTLGFVAAAFLGLALGPIIPTMLAVVRSSFRLDAGLATGVAFSFGSLGGGVVPWSMGALIVNEGALTGTVVLLALPAAMAALLIAIEQHSRSFARSPMATAESLPVPSIDGA